MNLFSKLFGTQANIEKKLEKQYIQIFSNMMDMSAQHASRTFWSMLKEAKREAAQEGSKNMAPNLGTFLLKNESSDPEIKSMLAKRRAEGVTDEDITTWYNLHDLERRMMIKIDDLIKDTTLKKLMEEGRLKKAEALKRLKRTYPIYGDSAEACDNSDPDAPLPYELKNRINVYINARSKRDLETLKKEIIESSSANAFLRKEISNGNI